jgi:hypothetical protein
MARASFSDTAAAVFSGIADRYQSRGLANCTRTRACAKLAEQPDHGWGAAARTLLK